MEQERILSRRTAGRELTNEELELIAGGAFTITSSSPDTMTYQYQEGNVQYYEPDDCVDDWS